MEKFSIVCSSVVPVPLKDIDTDMILPAQFLTSISREGYGENLFRRLRDTDSNFPLNLDRYKGAQILLADDNFGCGSSREHAVWALAGWGFKVVISKSFADIFHSNSAKNGLLTVVLEPSIVDGLLSEAANSDLKLTVDLDRQMIIHPSGKEFPFSYDSFRKHCLLNGLEDIDYLLDSIDTIKNFEKDRSEYLYFAK